jgi:hypothetical protein
MKIQERAKPMPITDPTLRAKQVKALKAYYKASNEQFAKYEANGYQHIEPETMHYPEFCRGMKCEAKTRSGAPCKNDGTNWGNGRCKYHGGASTGPVTPEGMKRVSRNSQKDNISKFNPSCS